MSARQLADHHAALLKKDSAISDDVIAQRGYWTATKTAELQRLGFSPAQRIVPSIVIPIRGIDGEVVSYQIRPDQPRIVDGKPVKYESPGGSVPVLDVPSGAREALRGTSALWITEGARKADAAVTAGLTCVSLPGVWAWASKIGDAKVLPDLLRIRYDERKVVIAFDNDVMVKPDVHAALEGLAEWLIAQGAWVHALYLPMDNAKSKLGLDDALADSYTTARLWEHVEEGIRPLPAKPKDPALPTGFFLPRIEAMIKRFVQFTDDDRGRAEITALALYVLHTWALDAAYATPYLHIRSPTKRAGKTRLLEVLELVCRNAMRASSITAAAVFQIIEMRRPTLLIDEVDTVFGGPREQAETLRGVLNDGFRPGGHVIRGTQEGEPKTYSTWCPKVLAGIENNTLPDTLQDRCIVISLERKTKHQTVERLRERDVADQARAMRARLSDWGLDATERLAEYRVEPIEEISDRQEDIWEPLLAIANDAGGDWPDRAKDAALILSAARSGDEDLGLILLTKLRDLFETTGVLKSNEIIQSCNLDGELPFSEMRHGTGLTVHLLAKMLRPYGVGPQQIEIGQDRFRGYRRRQLEPVWERYLTSPSPEGSEGSEGSEGNPDGSAENPPSARRNGSEGTSGNRGGSEGAKTRSGTGFPSDPSLPSDFEGEEQR